MPAPPTSESEVERDFLMWVGYCITTWADVEEKLFDVVWKCLQCPKEQAAIIYFRTPSLDARVTLADELVRNILPARAKKSGGHDHPSVKEWKKIERKFRDLLPTRNRVAHHPLSELKMPEGPGMLSGMRMHYLSVSDAEQLRDRNPDWMPLHIGDLRHHHILTLGLRSEIENFYLNTLLAHVR
jgi:hypothetical protein